MTTLRIFLAGEGPTELGRERQQPHHRGTSRDPGVLDALVERLAQRPFAIVGREYWDKPVEYRIGVPRNPEHTKVLGLALKAEEHGADVFVFARDRDRKEERELVVERGLLDAAAKHDLRIVGGVATESIEAWILALSGERSSELHRNPKKVLQSRFRISTTDEKVASVYDAKLDEVPDDAHSLLRWLERARLAFATALVTEE